MVKAKIVNPAKVQRKADITKFVSQKGTKGITQKGRVIRQPSRAVPLNPKASPTKPRSGTFATKRRMSKFG